ncbi:MAG: exo-alpha-sialidase [Clostridia bacterium]|nr:exo-alpha-sialidase [Clostridia bacterium]
MKKIGRQVCFLETTESNKRNGEGSFIRLKDNSIMFGYTEYIGDSGDDFANARISAVTSHDEGETWGEKRVLFTKPEGAQNIMSLSFLRMGNGDIGAFYILKEANIPQEKLCSGPVKEGKVCNVTKILCVRSSDEGETWGEPIDCLSMLDRNDYFVLNNDRVIKLKSGRILFALARHTIYQNIFRFSPGALCFIYSDDDGYTWEKAEEELVFPFDRDPAGYQEPGLYEMPDGRVRCYIRSSLGCQLECFSEDGGETWSCVNPNHFFTSPRSPMLIKAVGDYTVAIFNPYPEYHMRSEAEPWGRTPYVCAVSDDKGLTFSKDRIFYIEDDLSNSYCYPAIVEGDSYFLVAYYHTNNTGNCLNCTKIIKIKYNEIEQ